MRLALTAALFAAGLAPAAAQRPSTVDMTCAQARNVVLRQGAAVLGTGGQTYDRFVRDRNFCEPTEIGRRASSGPRHPGLLRRFTCYEPSRNDSSEISDPEASAERWAQAFAPMRHDVVLANENARPFGRGAPLNGRPRIYAACWTLPRSPAGQRRGWRSRCGAASSPPGPRGRGRRGGGRSRGSHPSPGRGRRAGSGARSAGGDALMQDFRLVLRRLRSPLMVRAFSFTSIERSASVKPATATVTR